VSPSRWGQKNIEILTKSPSVPCPQEFTHTIYRDKKITSKKIYRNPRVRITKNVGTVGTIAISIEFTRIERPQAVGDKK